MKDLLNEAYVMLKNLAGDEQCDHSVGICWCDDHNLLERMAAALDIETDQKDKGESPYVKHTGLYGD